VDKIKSPVAERPEKGDITDTLDMGGRKETKTETPSSGFAVRTTKFWTESLTGMPFVWIEGGTFMMGCRNDDPDGYDHEKPAHEVKVPGFWMGRYPVTQAQWKKIMGMNPSHFIKTPEHPVEQVSWEDAQKFLEKLNVNVKEGCTFKLPAEVQWEYAARSGGKAERYSGGDDIDDVAWFKENSEHSTQPVGLKRSNGLGIYDMSGNVMEWCEDIFDEDAYSKVRQNKPPAPQYGMERVVRGGGYNLDARRCRTTSRRRMSQRLKYINLGLRIVMVEESSSEIGSE
jgi:formylglycine-generating enzyme required for sulfatase activity